MFNGGLGRRSNAVRTRSKMSVAVAAAALVFSATAITAYAASPDSTRLMAARDADRLDSVDLGGATLSSKAYLWLDTGYADEDIAGVEFYVDDLEMENMPVSIDETVPWDLGGTDEDGTAIYADLSELDDGEHTLTARVFSADEIIVHSVVFMLDKSLDEALEPATKATRQPMSTTKIDRAGEVVGGGSSDTALIPVDYAPVAPAKPAVTRADAAPAVSATQTQPVTVSEPVAEAAPAPKVDKPAPVIVTETKQKPAKEAKAKEATPKAPVPKKADKPAPAKNAGPEPVFSPSFSNGKLR